MTNRFRRSKPNPKGDPEREAKIDAAIRHAEQVIKKKGMSGPVHFRPSRVENPGSDRALTRQANNSRPTEAKAKAHGQKPKRQNLALEIALRELLNIPADVGLPVPQPLGAPKKNAPRSKQAPPKSSPASPKAKSGRRTKLSFSVPEPKKLPKPDPRHTAVQPPVVTRRQALKDAARQKENLRRAQIAEEKATSRRAFNAKRHEILAQSVTAVVSPFIELRKRWETAFAYLQKFEHAYPDAPDVINAKESLQKVEAEWDRRQGLPADHPDYFPWPSTDAPGGDGAIGTTDWQEIGMLGYLGYHVGTTSKLTAVQRIRLLDHIYAMRLPPLNGITYMQSWASPRTSPRLRKMAEGVAAFARNAKRRQNPNLAVAIRQWEDDLSYLKVTFYDGRFAFPWPTL